MPSDSKTESIAAWRKNTPPPTPTTYNQFFQITETQPGTPTIFALITWNWERGRYEMRPVTFVDESTYNHVELSLDERNWYGLRRLLRNLGIKHLIDVECKTKSRQIRQSNLPPSVGVIQIA